MLCRKQGNSAASLLAALAGAAVLGASAQSVVEVGGALEAKCRWLEGIRGTNREAWLRSQSWFHRLDRKCAGPTEQETQTTTSPGWGLRCMLLLRAQNSGRLDSMQQQPWFKDAATHCPAFAHGARAAAAPPSAAAVPAGAVPVALDPVFGAAPVALDPELLATGCKWLQEEAMKSGRLDLLQQQPWYESLASGCRMAEQEARAPSVGAPSHSWSSIVKGVVQNKKCKWLRIARESNPGLASLGWFRDMEAKCEGPATGDHHAASSWHQLGHDVQFSSEAWPEGGDAAARYSNLEMMPTIPAYGGALERECKILYMSSGSQLARISQQPWYLALKRKCDARAMHSTTWAPTNVFV